MKGLPANLLGKGKEVTAIAVTTVDLRMSRWSTTGGTSLGATPQRLGWTVTGPSLGGRLHSLDICYL